jgi:hypothetical protein
MRNLLPSALVIAGLVAVPVIVAAQTPAPAPQPQAYRPGLGDLMTMTVQPRHIKLALAGKEKNWIYAAYELQELEEAFDRVSRAWPQWRAVPIADMMTSVREPMAAMGQAIKAADPAAFDAAYGELTKGCNGCHLGAKRDMIVIKTPDASMFPDQDFRPVQ